MAVMTAPENTPVWVNTARCKACDICVDACPAGVLSMKAEPSSTLGAMISVIAPDSCIGCNECELSCPDFAIYVAEKSEFKFAKLSDAAKARQEAITNNGYRLPADYKEAN
ncbi:4Fe-4S dicluster domain-containing protein [Sulfurovum mangrovi]|uniref:4Fe-4S dicluster domain-containing protein n=1 Tax=Sulfurovum mangrovi TaxID=2893889 RepID=UPI001E29D156|nr:4Fe-4S dicluster domain-containing protein [Sulfurovum mangrovi]UFH59801.1 4Fe-4S binding protein [Sulfurovum mangrovi]UFH60598.1 4Fe-4S binding protein [Sulfurovum mangrovi]